MKDVATIVTSVLFFTIGLTACDTGGPTAADEPKGSDAEGIVESVENDSTISVGEISPWEINADADRIGPNGFDSPAIDTVYAIETTTVTDSAGMTGTITVIRPFESTPETGQPIKIGK